MSKSLKMSQMSQTTPRASHSEPYSEDSEDEYSDSEYLDVDTWVAWFKTTDEYKQLQNPTGKQEPDKIAPAS